LAEEHVVEPAGHPDVEPQALAEPELVIVAEQQAPHPAGPEELVKVEPDVDADHLGVDDEAVLKAAEPGLAEIARARARDHHVVDRVLDRLVAIIEAVLVAGAVRVAELDGHADAKQADAAELAVALLCFFLFGLRFGLRDGLRL